MAKRPLFESVILFTRNSAKGSNGLLTQLSKRLIVIPYNAAWGGVNYMSGYVDIVDYLRGKQMAEMRGELANPDVVRISQRLDLFIVQSQKQRMMDGDNGMKGQAVYDVESSVQLVRG